MTLNEFKNQLQNLSEIAFELPNGQLVPRHFHVTEVGKITKDFVDCGGVLRRENRVNFQLWEADDYDHRLHPEKLFEIITLAENILNISNYEIEVEYQGNNTIGKYGLEIKGNNFLLTKKTTDCLAKDKCGIPDSQPEETNINSCSPGSGCC